MDNFNSLVVSDYDGTIKRIDNLNEFKKSLKLLNEIINSKICFMISTGRMFDSMFKEIINYNIPFNYLTCANGNVLFDDCFNIIWKKKISPIILHELKAYYKYILSIDAKDEYGNFTTKKAIEYCIELEQNNQIRKQLINQLLYSNLFDYCTDGTNKFKIHIFNSSDKVETIKIIKKLINISNDNIYTIGNGTNDLEMIKKYNGFILGNDMDNCEDYALEKYESFVSFLKDVKYGLVKKRI